MSQSVETFHLPNTLQSSPPLLPENIIGKGLAADVYAWGDGQVLKLFHAHVPRRCMEREEKITKAMRSAGAVAPEVRGTIEIDGRPGIIFERIDGPSLFDDFLQRPWTLISAVRLLAEIQATLHRSAAPADFPPQRDQIAHWINGGDWSAERKNEALKLLETLPDGDRLCHGDFHPGNILLSKSGPVIIDWPGATRGDPLGDVARTCVLIESGPVPEGVAAPLKFLMNLARGLVQRIYLAHYSRFHPIDQAELTKWKQVQSAAGGAWRNDAFY